jgi:site-specific DNA-methyltransferase (adenine-specific)
MLLNEIYLGDCLDLMDRIPTGSVDMILCDLPYGTTACKWDSIIPFERLWVKYDRIIKPNGAIVLTASQPFTSKLVMSNVELFRYELIWEKSCPSSFLDAARKPLKAHENILIFSKNRTVYNPQKWKIDDRFIDRRKTFNKAVNTNTSYGDHGVKSRKIDDGIRFPLSVISCNSHWSKGMHPTQKPVSLFEYLIRTYTNEGETVLDNCIGSGTTAIAAINTKRKFIGIEKDFDYWELATERVRKHLTADLI